MRYVTCWGKVWRLSDRNYRRLLRDFIADPESSDMTLVNYGKCLGEVENITDLTADGARELLEAIKA